MPPVGTRAKAKAKAAPKATANVKQPASAKPAAPAIQRTIRTRGMGASPGGHRQLPEARRTRLQPQRKQKTDVDTELEAGASSTQATAPEDSVASNLRAQTPPTTTSRSQSPHLETESDAPSQVPESRSSSPPPRRTTRSQTRSMSPETIERQQKSKATLSGLPKKVTKKAAKNLKRAKPDQVTDDRGLEVIEEETQSIERPTKRSRTDISAYPDEEIAEFMEAPQETTQPAANDSSADDGVVEVERPPRGSRSRSSSRPRLLPTTEAHAEDASAEESSSDEPPPQESPLTSVKALQQQRRTILTPRPTSYTSGKPKTVEPMTNDMAERIAILRKHFPNMPIPQFKTDENGRVIHPKGYNGPDVYLEDSYVEDEEEENLDMMDGPNYTRQYLARQRLEQQPLSSASTPQNLPPKSLESPEHEATGSRKGARASSSRPKPARALLDFAREDTTRILPTGTEMKQLLSDFDARKRARYNPSAPLPLPQQQRTRTRSEITPPRDERQSADLQPSPDESEPLNLQSDAQSLQDEQQPLGLESNAVNAMLDGDDVAALEGASEAQPEAPEPQTPTPQQPKAQESRGWFSGVTSLFATPLKIFGRQSQPTQAATTNGDSVVGVSPVEHLIPQTSDFAIPPTTPTPSNNRPIRRNLFAQSERRPAIRMELNNGPKTARHVRFADPEALPPIHMRNVLSEEEKHERWRQEDEDRNRKERQNRRRTMQAHCEDEDADDANQSVKAAQAGQKRKKSHPEPLPSNFNHEGHFSVPSSPTSSEEDDSDVEVVQPEVDNPKQRRQFRQSRSPYGVRSLLPELEPYDNRPWRVVYAKRFKQKHGRDPIPEVKGVRNPNADDIDRSLLPLEFLQKGDEYNRAEKPWSLYPRKDHLYAGSASCGGILEKEIENGIESGDNEKVRDALDWYKAFVPESASRPFHELNHRNAPLPGDDWHPTPKSSLATNSEGLGTSTRRNTYTGTLFAQPPNVQANLNEGKYPLAPRTSTPSLQPNENVFSASILNQEISSASILSQDISSASTSEQGIFNASDKLPSQQEATQTSLSLTQLDTFNLQNTVANMSLPELKEAFSKVPDDRRRALYDSLYRQLQKKVDSTFVYIPDPTPVPLSEGRQPSANTSAEMNKQTPLSLSEGHQPSTNPSATMNEQTPVPPLDDHQTSTSQSTITNEQDASVLQPKTWTQTPPPKPKPSNAQLPQVSAQSSAAELAKARYEKFKPVKPSGLRNVTQMSPLHHEQENRVSDEVPLTKEEWETRWRSEVAADRRLFDPEVMAAIDAIPDADILPASLFDLRAVYNFDTEVLEEVERLLP